jgi:hypothetical protein
MDVLKSIIKRLLSYAKSQWDFEDYPIEIWEKHNEVAKNMDYRAHIINWSGMIAVGESKQKALENLRVRFNSYKAQNLDLPRPGTKKRIGFASTENIDKYAVISNDFVPKILNEVLHTKILFISDLSLLPANKKNKEEIIKRTLSIYGVDITEMYDKPMYEVFKFIKNRVDSSE